MHLLKSGLAGPSFISKSIKKRAGLFLGLSLVLLLVPLRGQEKRQEPDAGELLKQGLVNISTFNTDRIVYAKKQELAKFIPAGQEVKVHLFYRVYKPAPAEELEIKVLDEVYPFPVQYLAEKGSEYKEEETSIKGTGVYVKDGAPTFPSPSSNPQVSWIEWNQWRESSQKWETKHRTEVSMRPAPETTMREAPDAAPQLDPAWLEQNRKLLGLSAEQLRQRPDIALGGATEVLRELNARATGPFWSPAPGGILLSPAAAGKLADGLTIDKVEYVPGSAEVKVIGRTSAMGLDADLLATTLRLAFGYEQVPYFSLDFHESRGSDWIAARDRISQEISDRLKQDSSFAERLRQSAFEVTDKTGRRHLIAYLDQVDPDLAASAMRRMPMNMDLVFRPKWLKRTRLGEMLFIADQSIKELWHGAAVWTPEPSRALAVDTHIAPKFWSERNAAKEELEELLHRSIDTSTSTRWWFTPGGQVGQSEHVLDLSQVQPVLQTERVGGTGKASYDLDLGMGLKVHQEIVYDPFASMFNQEDPWSKAVVQEVNQHFDSYAQAFPEWEGLRQVFRAYVFAIWLVKNDPNMGHRLLAQLPPSRPPSKSLPNFWPDPQILIVRMGSEPGSVELEQATISGGVGFEHDLLKAVPGAVSAGSMGTVSAFPSGAGFTPNPIDDDVPATAAGYQLWREGLLRERGYLWGWINSHLVPGEIVTFAGIAAVLALITFWRDRKKKVPFCRFQAGAMTADWLATTLIFTLVALYPDVYKNHTAPFTGWWVAVIIYTLAFFKGDRIGRFGLTIVVMAIVLIWTAFTPGLGEIVRGMTPLHLATPALGATEGALPADTIYSLEAIKEGLTLCRSAEPRYALYPLLVLLVAIGFWFEFKVEDLRPKKAAAT